jgi:membrane protein DedA with SNARE-associated domain
MGHLVSLQMPLLRLGSGTLLRWDNASMVDFLSSFSVQLIYLLLFVLLLLCGIGFPMAEELVLLAGGVLVASRVLNPLLMFLVTFLGVLVGDVLLFWLGHGLATKLTTTTYFARWLPPQKIARGGAFFARYGSATVFLARFIPGLRAPTFFLAGTMQMPLWHFTAIDSLAGLIFVPMICWLGYMFADHFDVLTYWFRHVERATVTILVLLALSWWLCRYRSQRRTRTTLTRASGADWP